MRWNAKPNPKLLFGILAFALSVRLLALYGFGFSAIKFGDAPDYLSAAAQLCSSGSYPDRGSMPFFRAPGLPFFIAAATLCQTQMVWMVKLALAVVDTLSVALVFLLAQELFGNRRLSLFAATGAAVYPFFVAQVSDVQTEALFMFLLLASIWLMLRAVRSPSPWIMLASGACASAAALVRPVGLLLLPLLGATFFHLGAAKWNRRARLLAWFAIGSAICLGPWVVRNAFRFHELILVNDGGGYNFWRGTSPEMAEVNRAAGPQAFSAASIRFETVISPAMAREIEEAAKTPSSRDREWYRRAMGNLAEDPRAFGARLLRNAWVYWRPWLNPQARSGKVVAASGIMMISLDILALIGWNLLRRRNRRLALWCVAWALSFWILQVPFHVVGRFRIPITDPFLIVFAAASLAAALEWLHRGPVRFGLHARPPASV